MIINNKFGCDSVSSLFYCRTKDLPSAAVSQNLTAHCLFSGTVFVDVHNSSKETALVFGRPFFVVPANPSVYGSYTNKDVVIDNKVTSVDQDCNSYMNVIENSNLTSNKSDL